jgi:iron uptake system EfeUOB component EfeO/EfeM
MFKVKALLATVILAAVSLTACSSASNEIKTGATNMRTVLADVKKAVDANDAEKVKTQAVALEDAWAKFEDAVKAKDKAIYDQIEEPLQAVEGGAKVSPLDQKVLTTQIQALDGLLAPLTK